MAFSHLHTHTEHSLLDGMIRIEELFEYVRGLGQDAIAITDHGSLSAMWKAQRAADRAGVKLIVGLETYLAIGDRRNTGDVAAASPRERGFIEIERDDVSGDEGEQASAGGSGEPGDDLAARLSALALARKERPPVALAEATRRPNRPMQALDAALLAEIREVALDAAEAPAPTGGIRAARDAESATLAAALADRLGPERLDLLFDALRPVKRRFHEHLTLIAMNSTGWANLLALQNEAVKPSSRHQGKPRVDRELLRGRDEGLLCLTGCLGGPVLGPLSRGEADIAAKNLDELIGIFGSDRVYVEIMEHGIAHESAIVPDAVALARSRGVRIVATNDAHYLKPDQARAHAAWLAHQSTSTLADPKYAFNGHGFHVADEDEMRARRPEPWWQEACDETARVADRIEPRVLPESRIRLPHFPTPDGYSDSAAYFHARVLAGAHRRYGDGELPAEVRARLNEEVRVVQGMGMLDYFLIVDDMVSWARSQGILVGAGRGSAGGSMLAYCLGIHDVDPLRHGLLFERFLDPGRVGMPDIDTDFEAARRPEVFEYLARKWGADKVARIGTFSFSRAKKALKDAARVLELDRIGARLANEVPELGGPTFASLADTSLHSGDGYRAALAAAGDEGAEVAGLAAQFEGLVSGLSIHACGFLITDEPIAQLVPLRYDPKAVPGDAAAAYTAWDGDDVEDLGLCKIDVLGLTNLDIVRAALHSIDDPGIDLDAVPDPDTDPAADPSVANAWRILRDAATEGLFQIEGTGITDVVRDIQPTSWADLTAILALYRPGPMAAGMHTRYGALKHGQERFDWGEYTDDPVEQEWLRRVLGVTHGLAIYQEQIMQLSQVIAGFDPAERSQLRKAMGKKKPELMAPIYEQFTHPDRCGREYRDPATGELVSPAFRVETAKRVWASIEKAAEYLFNKSHSQAYAKLTFATAWLKGNYPAEFGAGLLSVRDDDDRRVRGIRSLEREGIEVLPPDVNRSGVATRPEGRRAVRLGLSEVKGVGAEAAAAIVANRERYGGFTQLWQVVSTGASADPESPRIGVGVHEALIQAGAYDEFGARLGMMVLVRSIAPDDRVAVPASEWSTVERSIRQRSVLLTSFGSHPLEVHAEEVDRWSPSRGLFLPEQARRSTVTVEELREAGEQRSVRLIGLLASVDARTYSGGKLLSLSFEGASGQVLEGVMWNDAILDQEAVGGVPRLGSIVAARGDVRMRRFERQAEDPETGDSTIEVVEYPQLTVRSMQPVPVRDDSVRAMPAPRIGMLEFGAPDAEPEPEPEPEPFLDFDPAPAPGPGPGSDVLEPGPALDPAVPEARVPGIGRLTPLSFPGLDQRHGLTARGVDAAEFFRQITAARSREPRDRERPFVLVDRAGGPVLRLVSDA